MEKQWSGMLGDEEQNNAHWLLLLLLAEMLKMYQGNQNPDLSSC